MFARRGFNIESLTVSATDDPTVSRMTIVVEGPGEVLEQLSKQLYKLMDVIKVSDHTGEATVERELALIKVSSEPEKRAEIMQIADIFRASIVDVSESTFIVEVTGDEEKLDALQSLLRQYGIKELVRSGKVALVRGAKMT
jgi:acetolactate synthase-1/3 small subunit